MASTAHGILPFHQRYSSTPRARRPAPTASCPLLPDAGVVPRKWSLPRLCSFTQVPGTDVFIPQILDEIRVTPPQAPEPGFGSKQLEALRFEQ